MTQQQATIEMKYRLSKYVLQVLINEEIITEAETLWIKREWHQRIHIHAYTRNSCENALVTHIGNSIKTI